MKRVLAMLAGVTVAAGLLVAGTYGESQRKARDDVRECTPTPAEVAEHADLASRIGLLPHEVIASPQFARIVGVDADGIRWIEDCIDDRRAVRWGPWNVWNRVVLRNED